MSDASKCDRCGVLFEKAFGDVTIETIHVRTQPPGNFDTWSELDFCPACSAMVIELIGAALGDFQKAD